MKILLIHNRYKAAGGEDVVCQEEAELLLRNRHLVEVLVFDNANIKSFVDKLRCGLGVAYNVTSAHQLRLKIEEFQPDVIHVHNFLPLASPSIFFVAREYRIPVVVTLHNYRLICPGATLFHNGRIFEKSIHSIFPIPAILNRVYRNSIWQTAAVASMTAIHSLLGTWRNRVSVYITLTSFARTKFLNAAIGIPERKLIVKPNFIKDVGKGDVRQRKDYYLFVGRLTEEKGILTLLNATRLSNFKLVIIGTGPLSEVVAQHAQENPRITFLGFQQKHIVIKYMKSCRALLFPSVWYEGFPITLLEAFSTGTAVIASNLGAMAEIVTSGVNGLHFEAGNEKELVARITELNADPQLLRQLSTTARSIYLEHYTPENNYPLMMSIYRKAIAAVSVSESRFGLSSPLVP
jgi:glycosyltransferase involved in cell wall biosynthesis